MSLTRTTRRSRLALPLGRGWGELIVVAALYVGYSASRLLASDDVASAHARAERLLDLERGWHLDAEHALNGWFARVDWLGVLGSYWYATTHYIVTLAVLVWIFRRSIGKYRTARRILVLASLLGLACYLAWPTAPPRLVPGFTDVLALHADAGWWAADASAPRGFGGLTNELAAFPSLHAGWAAWVALVVHRAGVRRPWRAAALAYAVTTSIVVIGTGNHWILDVIAGWLVVGAATVVVDVWESRGPSGRARE